MKNLVSVIIPFYKNFEIFQICIKSVIEQTYKKIEIIIIYDGNESSIKKSLKDIQKKNKKIKLIFNHKRIGAGLSRNKGIKKSKGQFLAFIDSDDVWKKNKIEKQINFMKKNKFNLTHTSYNIINFFGKKIGNRAAENLDYNKLIRSCDIGLSTVIINKSVLKPDILFPNLTTKEDYVFWLKLSRNGSSFFGLKKNLTDWRDTPKSLSKSVFQKLFDAFSVYYLYEKKTIIESLFRILILSLNYLKKK